MVGCSKGLVRRDATQDASGDERTCLEMLWLHVTRRGRRGREGRTGMNGGFVRFPGETEGGNLESGRRLMGSDKWFSWWRSETAGWWRRRLDEGSVDESWWLVAGMRPLVQGYMGSATTGWFAACQDIRHAACSEGTPPGTEACCQPAGLQGTSSPMEQTLSTIRGASITAAGDATRTPSLRLAVHPDLVLPCLGGCARP